MQDMWLVVVKQWTKLYSNIYKRIDECQRSTALGPRSYEDLGTNIFVCTNVCWLRAAQK